MKLSQLKRTLPGARSHNFHEREIKSITCDSRSNCEGALFIAIRGEQQDGHPYAVDALANGAAAVVVEHKLDLPAGTPQIVVPDTREAAALLSDRFYKHPSRALKLVGITGTNGKTTTSWMLKAILEAAGHSTGLLGTVQYLVGQRCIPAKNTTPSPIDINRMLAEMLQARQKHAVMEVSSHALVQKRTRGLAFDGAVFTNLTDKEHLDYHKSFAAYRDAKCLLFEALPKSSFAAINIEDPSAGFICQRTSADVMTYGVCREADVRAVITRSTMSGTQFELYTPAGTTEIEASFFGRYNISNAAAAAAAAISLGVGIEAIRQGLGEYSGTPGRLEPVDCGQDFSVLVDYAHSADALANVLAALREVAPARIILVFGCGGDRDKSKRPEMGRIASKYADYFVLTADNSRSERTQDIIADITAGVGECEHYHIEPDRTAAIAAAIRQAQPGDVVLIAGKGHETYQVLGNTTIPYDDRREARKALLQQLGAKEPLEATVA